ncbi:MAG: GNAT family N-acetyltransferase [Bdellovibrionota bacterium]
MKILMTQLTLRPLRSSDLKTFLTWASDPEVTRSLMWDHYTSEDEASRFLKNVAEKHPWFMAICLDGTPVGAITLDQKTGSGICRAELGYVVAKKFWGKGLATAASKIALDRGFADLGVERIEALVDPDNEASIKVLENSGMVREGVLRNYLVHRSKVRDRYIYAKVR